MNEKLQYASMIEMPINTCNITSLTTKRKRAKRKRKVSEEQVKAELIEKINNESTNLSVQYENYENEQSEPLNELKVQENNEQPELIEQSAIVYETQNKKFTKKPFKVTVIGVQLMIIGLLVATILVTNALFEDSGINVFLKSVFLSEQAQTDTRHHSDFAPVIAMGDNEQLVLEQGVITFKGKGSVYAPCDGKVVDVTKNEQGSFDIKIMHSDNFTSVISGVEYSYVQQGQKVYANIPVGYLEDNGASICFNDSLGNVITDYQIDNGLVKWAV